MRRPARSRRPWVTTLYAWLDDWGDYRLIHNNFLEIFSCVPNTHSGSKQIRSAVQASGVTTLPSGPMHFRVCTRQQMLAPA